MAISDATIRQIQDTADIVDVVGDFVSLKKKGQNYWACCPFHNEKSPSFSVAPTKGIYKCFGCGKAGDSIKFVMDVENLSYPEALRYLAKKYGIHIEEDKVQTDEKKAELNLKESLLIASKFAQEYYSKLLFESEEGQSVGLSYFKERGFSVPVIQKFQLGYSLSGWDNFEKEAINAGYLPETLEKAGLLIKKEDTQRYYDRFRGRAIFAIHDISGRPIAFAARTFKKDEQPKYINSPETEIYHKSDVLYGLFQAKNAIRNADNCYLVEGYADVISMHEAGVENVVASSGTSLTEGQIKLIKRFTQNITLLYDGDNAGIKASFRGIDMLLEQGMNIRAVLLPGGEDPDSFVQKFGAAAFKKELEDRKQDFIHFKAGFYAEAIKNDPIKKAEFTKEIIESIGKIPDPIQAQVYLQETAKLMQLPENVIINEFDNQKKKQKTPKPSPQNQVPPPDFFAPTTSEEMALEPYILPEETHFKNDSFHYQEIEFIRLMLSYGHIPIADEVNYAQYLFNELENIDFQTPIHREILSICRQTKDEQRSDFFESVIRHAEPQIKETAINIVTQPFKPSDKWAEFEVYVPALDSNLALVSETNLLRLKHRLVVKMIQENLQKLAQTTDWEEQIILLQENIHFKSLEKEFAIKLNMMPVT